MTANPLSSELLALAAKVEALTGPDREVDALVAAAFGIIDYDGPAPLGTPFFCVTDDGLRVRFSTRLDDGSEHSLASRLPKPFTASLDAAMTLVPEGCLWVGGLAQTGRAAMAVCPFGSTDGEHSTASTPALALTAASLRAIAAQQPNTTGDEG